MVRGRSRIPHAHDDDGRSRRPWAVGALALVLGFEGLTAVPSGVLMMARPDGSAFGLPLSVLEHAPFDTFFVPGALLFAFLGVLPLFAAWLLWSGASPAWTRPPERWTGRRAAWLAGAAGGAAIVVWIATQVVMLRAFAPLHAIYGGLGLVALVLALTPSAQAWARAVGEPHAVGERGATGAGR
jgi:hypothetical protein